MNKKLFVIFLVIFSICTMNVYSKVGLGLQLGSEFSEDALDGNIGATIKFSSLPMVFALETSFNYRTFTHIGGSIDWWIGNPTISGSWKWFYGIGLAAGGNIDAKINFVGLRFLLGMHMMSMNFLELYLQCAPEIGFTFKISEFFHYPDYHIPVNLGFRIWF